jgi:hypothetical protein
VATIKLPSSTSGLLELFDIQGRFIASVAVPATESGAQTVDIAGSAALPSGLYLARLSTGHDAVTRKARVSR